MVTSVCLHNVFYWSVKAESVGTTTQATLHLMEAALAELTCLEALPE